jgi:hypothetical protein
LLNKAQTIGIFVILGSTYSGEFENVKAIADKLDEYEKKTGIHIPIHVDAASGGFVAPFVYPDLEWDFRIPRVCSINASGHKYGMSTVGVGWCIWRSDKYLPKEMIFELHYLGETDYSFNLNFSRPAHPILGQMFCCKCCFGLGRPRGRFREVGGRGVRRCGQVPQGSAPGTTSLPLRFLLPFLPPCRHDVADTQSSTSASAATAA